MRAGNGYLEADTTTYRRRCHGVTRLVLLRSVTLTHGHCLEVGRWIDCDGERIHEQEEQVRAE